MKVACLRALTHPSIYLVDVYPKIDRNDVGPLEGIDTEQAAPVLQVFQRRNDGCPI